MIVRFHRNTSAQWNAKEDILPAGEAAYETDTKTLMIGDGYTKPRDLDHFLPEPQIQALIDAALANVGGGDGSGITMDDVQTAINAHINSQTPHPVYDDGPSLALLYENAKV